LSWIHGNAKPKIVPEQLQPTRTNYFIGKDRSAWKKNISSYGKVRYQAIWPGVDAVFYGTEGNVEFDFDVAVGADPNAIAFALNPEAKLSIQKDGSLLAEEDGHIIRFPRPTLYQEVDHHRKPVDGGYVMAGLHSVRFSAGQYDHSRQLTIDPVMLFAQLAPVGGSAASNTVVAVDGSGNVYVGGAVSGGENGASYFFGQAATAPGFQKTPPSSTYFPYVIKLSPDFQTVLYATYIGGADTAMLPAIQYPLAALKQRIALVHPLAHAAGLLIS